MLMTNRHKMCLYSVYNFPGFRDAPEMPLLKTKNEIITLTTHDLKKLSFEKIKA